MTSFVLSFFPLDVLDEIWELIESVSEGFLTYSGGGRVMRRCWVIFQCRGVLLIWGWSGGAMVLGNLPVPGRPTNLD